MTISPDFLWLALAAFLTAWTGATVAYGLRWRPALTVLRRSNGPRWLCRWSMFSTPEAARHVVEYRDVAPGGSPSSWQELAPVQWASLAHYPHSPLTVAIGNCVTELTRATADGHGAGPQVVEALARYSRLTRPVAGRREFRLIRYGLDARAPEVLWSTSTDGV